MDFEASLIVLGLNRDGQSCKISKFQYLSFKKILLDSTDGPL